MKNKTEDVAILRNELIIYAKNILKEPSEEDVEKWLDEKVESFLKYKDILLEWNQKINLTAIEAEKEIFIKHFLDSVSLLDTDLVKEGSRIIDVGTGAGFPGIPVKIVRDDIELTLLDSLNKRINFLKKVGKSLNLSDVTYVHSRAEDGARSDEHREKYDIATARAVANMTVLLEYCIPFVKINGYFICLKGPNVDEEIEESKKAAKLLGAEFQNVFHVKLPDEELNHTIVVYKKVKATPKKYPRKAGTPAKSPLK